MEFLENLMEKENYQCSNLIFWGFACALDTEQSASDFYADDTRDFSEIFWMDQRLVHRTD